ncbi:hypothetical protein N7467_003083 [Penicillium canescens]|nr:hypothetical protein N7467_003083 [Penicillium canescens]
MTIGKMRMHIEAHTRFSHGFNSDIGIGEGSIASSDRDAREEDKEGYYEGSNEGEEREHFKGEEVV